MEKNLLQLVDGDRHGACLGRELLADLLSQRPGDEVWRCRFDSNLGKHHGACFLCRTFIFANHCAGPRGLAGNIQIMRAILGAGSEGKLAIFRIRADGGDENICLLGERLKILVVETADFDFCNWLVLLNGDLFG